MKIPAKPTTPVQSVRYEKAANGGLISHTRHFDPARKPNGPYVENPEPLPGSHPDVESAVAHLRASFPAAKAKRPKKPASRVGAQASAIGGKMLGQGDGGYSGGDGY